MLQGNNAALLGSNLVIDPSGWADQFRDGQKLRQEYDARQTQKELGKIMQNADHNERLDLARQSRYAGSLIPELQKYEEARQKAALDNLKASSDIGKTYAETGKLGAESGEIGAKTQGLVRENTAGVQNDISALAVTQNPKLFALGIGEMVKQGLINPERADMMLKMVASDQPNAAAVLQSMVMANPELAKLFKPEAKTIDAGDKVYSVTNNPFTGEQNAPNAQIIKGASPDNVLDNNTSRFNNQNTVRGSMYNSDNTYNASVYGTDVRSADTRYNTDVTSQDRQLKLDQDGKIGWAKISQTQQKLDNPRANNPRPVAATKEMSKHLTNMRNNAKTLRTTASWIQKIESGELNLGAMSNLGNAAANYTGVDGIGGNPAAYAELKAAMVGLASDALRLNSGVQTDMDYKRAMEEMQAGTYIPRSNKTAIALLNKIVRDFSSKNKAEYASYSDYKREYDGVALPEYGKSPRMESTKSSQQQPKKLAGQYIIGGILRGS